MAKLDRWLRNIARANLDLPPRPNRKELDLKQHARNHNIDPSLELPADGGKAGARAHKLQTLLLPENLESRLEAIQDLARLSKQEMGLSTLFVAFGFIEWYQSDASTRPAYAPLLLLPVQLRERKAGGKKFFSVVAEEDVPETNITLAKYLAEKIRRDLPSFEPEETQVFPIESYFSAVEKAIDGLQRWKLRRFLTLGHFSFGRLAMYQDLDPADREPHPSSHFLVQSVLRGIEQVSETNDGLPSVPEDYNIDDPQIEKWAPLLVHDADASQHSAIVNVVKGENLVIEGPPGTGKSQTITNIIANVLAGDGVKTVLFLSEKLAALEVVKRRLDKSGLGEFCLELHSEKSSPRGVIESLKSRIDAKDARLPYRKLDRKSWDDARSEISRYVAALHRPERDGETPFNLFWRSIAEERLNEGVGESFRSLHLDEDLLADPDKQRNLLNEVRVYGEIANDFLERFGHPSRSPWATIEPDIPSFRAKEFLFCLRRYADALNEVRGLVSGFMDLGIETIESLAATCERLAKVPPPPALDGVEILRACDLSDARQFIRNKQALMDAELKLTASALKTLVTIDHAKTVAAFVARLDDPALASLQPVEIEARAQQRIDRAIRIQQQISTLHPVLRLLRLDDSLPFSSLPALRLGPLAAKSAQKARRGWLSWQAESPERYAPIRDAWKILHEADAQWRHRLHGYNPSLRPKSSQVLEALAAFSIKYSALKPWRKGEKREGKQVLEGIGFEKKGDIDADVRDFARHLDAIEDSAASRCNLRPPVFAIADGLCCGLSGIEAEDCSLASLRQIFLTLPAAGAQQSVLGGKIADTRRPGPPPVGGGTRLWYSCYDIFLREGQPMTHGTPPFSADAALRHFRSYFTEPKDVVAHPQLSRDEKLAILREWEQDALRLSTSESEGMGGGEESMLGRVEESIGVLERSPR